MNNSRMPRVAGDLAGSAGAGVRLLSYIAATQCYHPREKRPDPEKGKEESKRKNKYIQKHERIFCDPTWGAPSSSYI